MDTRAKREPGQGLDLAIAGFIVVEVLAYFLPVHWVEFRTPPNKMTGLWSFINLFIGFWSAIFLMAFAFFWQWLKRKIQLPSVGWILLAGYAIGQFAAWPATENVASFFITYPFSAPTDPLFPDGRSGLQAIKWLIGGLYFLVCGTFLERKVVIPFIAHLMGPNAKPSSGC